MSDAAVLDILRGALVMAAQLGAPILATALAIGVVISILQTVTSIQEMTLTFVPKLIGVALVLTLAGAWMLQSTVEWVTALWEAIPEMV